MIEIQRINDNTPMAPLASEANESDEIARKMLQDVSSLVDDTESAPNVSDAEPTASGSEANRSDNKSNGSGGAIKKSPSFVYALPGEVLKTSLNRHQRGIMDSRIYQLLTKKEIILPQVRELSDCPIYVEFQYFSQIFYFDVFLADFRGRTISRNAINSSVLSSGSSNDVCDLI